MSLTDGLLYNESRGRMDSGIWGDNHLAAGPMQVHQAALTDVNRRLGTNYSLQQLADDPHIGKLVGDTYAQIQQEAFPGRPDLAASAYNGGAKMAQQSLASGQPPPNQAYVDSALAHSGLGVSGLGSQAPAGQAAGMGAATPVPPSGAYDTALSQLGAMFPSGAGAPPTPASAVGNTSAPSALGLQSSIGLMGNLMAGFKNPVQLIPVDYNPFAAKAAQAPQAPLMNGGSALSALSPLSPLQSRR